MRLFWWRKVRQESRVDEARKQRQEAEELAAILLEDHRRNHIGEAFHAAFNVGRGAV